MQTHFKQHIQKIINLFFIVLACLYLLACLTPYISSSFFFGFTFLALAFLLLLLAMLLGLLWLLITKNKKWWLCVLIIFLGYKNISSNIGFNIFSSNQIVNNNTGFRVLSWNVKNFQLQEKKYDTVGCIMRNMMQYISKAKADIVCIQDFEQTDGVLFFKYLDFFRDSLHYPNIYFSVDIDSTLFYGRSRYGTCIFSKFPISNTASIQYAGKYFSESLGYADLKIKDKTIRVFNTHLRSMYLNIQGSNEFEFKYKIEDTMLVFHSSKLTKIKRFDTAHISQARLIKKVMDTTTVPFILCADLNSTPASFTYHHISKNLNDAFIKNSFWWNKTYATFLPFIRIDVVLTSKELQPVSYINPKLNLSDHYPIVTDIVFANNQ